MLRRFGITTALLAISSVVMGSDLGELLTHNGMDDFAEFEAVELGIVYSGTDDDAQIVTAIEGDAGIITLRIFNAAGRQVLYIDSNDRGRVGQTSFVLETPEPSLDELYEAYPEGNYLAVAVTNERRHLVADVAISHALLDVPVITNPLEGAQGVARDGLIATWQPIPGAASIRFEIEDEATERALKVDLAGDATSFALPDGWLEPATEYTMDVKAKSENHNVTVADVRFVTSN